MTLTLAWTNPTPLPTCGYKAFYRRPKDSAYTESDTSGMTSGSTTIALPLSAVASYEGYIQTDCCSDLLSDGVPFGVNGYSQFTIAISIVVIHQQWLVTVTSPFANPYDTIISGTINFTLLGTPTTQDYTITYAAGSTSYAVEVGVANGSAVFVSNVITAYAPEFDNGGQLQQFDPALTPSYFQLLDTSGHTWTGSPTSLPSFTLDAFNVTEVDGSSNPIAGDLLLSWIQPSAYSGGTSPYNIITITVTDQDNALLGETIVSTLTNGLRNTTISLTKAARALSTSTLFTMKTYWADDGLITTKTFYLPDF